MVKLIHSRISVCVFAGIDNVNLEKYCTLHITVGR